MKNKKNSKTKIRNEKGAAQNMSLKEKFSTAKPTTWLTEGISDKEVREIVDNAKSLRYVDAHAKLNDISKLEDDWNGYGAEAFSEYLIQHCRKILNELIAEPFIAPTACNSIQFEFKKENGDYLEFEIFEEGIEMYSKTQEKGESNDKWYDPDATVRLKEAVKVFFKKESE